MAPTILLRTAVVLAACASAHAQSFSYTSFAGSTGLTMNGTAAVSGAVLRVTPGSSSAIGATWRTQPVSVSAGFDTTFSFQISSLVFGGADGIAFVIHDDPRGASAIGGDGSAMGYGTQAAAQIPIANSLAIEIDTYNAGAPWSDPDDNHVSVHTNATGDNNGYENLSIGVGTPVALMSNGAIHKMRVQYVPGTLKVYVDDLVNPLITSAYNFTTGGTWLAGGSVGGLNLSGGTSAYVGFTAACGGATEIHDITGWDWTSTIAAPVAYCTAGTSTHGCVPSIGASGQPSASLANACTITVTGVEGQQNGLVFYGVDNSGFAALPWGTGSSFMCVKSPIQRTPAQATGGSFAACDGTLALDWNAFQQAFPTGLGNPWTSGAQVYAQGWYRDPPAPKTTHLSNALELTCLP